MSKAQYAKVQADRASTAFVVGFFILLTVLFGLGTIGVLIAGIGNMISTRVDADAVVITMFGFLLCGSLSLLCCKCTQRHIEYLVNTDPGIPFTRANTANLPAPDSLVRASEEPKQVQESVLLRAATETQETPPEQLVRAAGGPE